MTLKSFKTREEARTFFQKDENYMGKYDHELVTIDGKKVIMCGTNMPYEDIIWDCYYQMLNRLSDQFPELEKLGGLPLEVSDLRDAFLDKLQENNIIFEDVNDEY